MTGNLLWQIAAVAIWLWALVKIVTRPKQTWNRGRAGQAVAAGVVVLGNLDVGGVLLPAGAVVMLVLLRRWRSRGEVGVPPAERWPGSG